MDDLQVDVRERKTQGRESILTRREILAPPGYVRFYHETKAEFLTAIDKEGLRDGIEKNLGSPDQVTRRNMIMDEVRPPRLVAGGISRLGLYAYPHLEHGHGLRGASERFVRHDWAYYQLRFEGLQEYYPDELIKLGVKTLEDYIYKMTDPDHLRSVYPREVVELMVDPAACFVGDLEYFNRISDDVNMRGIPEDRSARDHGSDYWENCISLVDFLRWYRKPEYMSDGRTIRDGDMYRDGVPFGTGDYLPIKGTPTTFPWSFNCPEILIPGEVPQEHIRLIT